MRHCAGLSRAVLRWSSVYEFSPSPTRQRRNPRGPASMGHSQPHRRRKSSSPQRHHNPPAHRFTSPGTVMTLLAPPSRQPALPPADHGCAAASSPTASATAAACATTAPAAAPHWPPDRRRTNRHLRRHDRIFERYKLSRCRIPAACLDPSRSTLFVDCGQVFADIVGFRYIEFGIAGEGL